MEKRGQTGEYLKYIFRLVLILVILWIFYQAVIRRIGGLA